MIFNVSISATAQLSLLSLLPRPRPTGYFLSDYSSILFYFIIPLSALQIAYSYILQNKSSRKDVEHEGEADNLRRIPYKRFVSYIQHYHLTAHRESLSSFKTLFQQCDSDGDGLLSPSEMWLCAKGLKHMEKQEGQKRTAMEADSKQRAVVSVKRDADDTIESRGSEKGISCSPIRAVPEKTIPGRRRDSGRHTADAITVTVPVDSKKELLPNSTIIPPSSLSNPSSCEDEDKQEEDEEEEEEEAFYSSLRHSVPSRNNFQDSKFSFTTAKYFFQK